ncbi:MAG: pyridoxine 5'-phosphate synthase [Candidatus Hydrogenedentota bacterium]
MIALSVNLNKVALLRNQRALPYPSVTGAARVAIDAGCRGITVHPRPDERHIRRADLYDLAAMLPEGVEFNIEGYPSPDFLALVRDIRPGQCTLVPDSPEQSTSDHGWDIDRHAAMLTSVIAGLRADGIRVSLFVDPVPLAARRAKSVGADRIELYTGPYASAFARGDHDSAVAPYAECAHAARTEGLGINAGHDLTLDNLAYFIEQVPNVLEVSIGHALIADALFMGLENAVGAYLTVLRGA